MDSTSTFKDATPLSLFLIFVNVLYITTLRVCRYFDYRIWMLEKRLGT